MGISALSFLLAILLAIIRLRVDSYTQNFSETTLKFPDESGKIGNYAPCYNPYKYFFMMFD